MRTGGGYLDVQHPCNLLVRIPFDLVQDKHHPRDLVEPLQQGKDLLGIQLVQHALGNRDSLVFTGFGKQFLSGDAGTEVVNRRMNDDPAQPSRKIVGDAGVQAVEYLDKHIVDNFPCIFAVGYISQGNGQGIGIIGFIKMLLGPGMAPGASF